MSGYDTSDHCVGLLVHFDGHSPTPISLNFQCNDANHWSAKTLYKSSIGWPLVCVLLIPKRNMVFLFKAIKFTSDILNFPPVNKEGLFSAKQGRGQELLLSCIASELYFKLLKRNLILKTEAEPVVFVWRFTHAQSILTLCWMMGTEPACFSLHQPQSLWLFEVTWLNTLT